MKLSIRQLLLFTTLAAIFCGSLIRAKLSKNGVEGGPLYFPRPINSNFAETHTELIKPIDGEARIDRGLLWEGNHSVDASSDH